MARLIAGLEGGVASSPRARLLRFHRLVFSPHRAAVATVVWGGGGDQRPALEVWEREIPLIHT